MAIRPFKLTDPDPHLFTLRKAGQAIPSDISAVGKFEIEEGRTRMSEVDIEDQELRARIALLEDPESEESIQPKLPKIDIAIAIVGIILLCAVMTIWGYGR